MQFHSTLNNQQHCDFKSAALAGLAADGGLFVPDFFPKIKLEEFAALESYPEFASQLLRYFIDAPLQNELDSMCQLAFNFAVPNKQINVDTWQLELFHGPTLSFKDFGARFLAQCFARIPTEKPLTILVATSGDTGSAVASAFFKKYPIQVIVLFPQGKISLRQQQQITCWQDNVLAIAVEGAFDDCQQLVKSAFADPQWKNNYQLSTANSINIARLLPQVVYYAYTSLRFHKQQGIAPGFIVPSGNLGNVTAAYWARQMGFPIREIVIATNANRPLTHYLDTGEYRVFPTQVTLANAMDVGNPSNFARLRDLFPDFTEFKSQVRAIRVDDQQIKEAIVQAYQQEQVIICPHTATGYYARQQLDKQPWIIVATAHPCKFENVIEPIINFPLPAAPELEILLNRAQHFEIIPADLSALTAVVKTYFA